MNEKQQENIPQNVIMEDRKKLRITGVTDVDSFGESSVLLYTVLGEMAVYGSDLHVDTVSTETGELCVTGMINSVVYGDSSKRAPLSFIGKLFR